ncbi:hypothetical protein ABD87_15060 [Lysinibacillus sphaericus]|uniref:hypothetical protein n=1 Tax=Lysinibacillus sphaericus TaxID=1421 RepID=UPI0018CE5D8D|nr:hypothetical protein [Lysinibacillus sphaericus]MBG9730809.1 hypothetical protein [Lysinibacillus sphaericus]
MRDITIEQLLYQLESNDASIRMPIYQAIIQNAKNIRSYEPKPVTKYPLEDVACELIREYLFEEISLVEAQNKLIYIPCEFVSKNDVQAFKQGERMFYEVKSYPCLLFVAFTVEMPNQLEFGLISMVHEKLLSFYPSNRNKLRGRLETYHTYNSTDLSEGDVQIKTISLLSLIQQHIEEKAKSDSIFKDYVFFKFEDEWIEGQS